MRTNYNGYVYYLLLDPFFHLIVGFGCPDAEQLTSAWSSRTTFKSLGSIIHSGGTINNNLLVFEHGISQIFIKQFVSTVPSAITMQ